MFRRHLTGSWGGCASRKAVEVLEFQSYISVCPASVTPLRIPGELRGTEGRIFRPPRNKKLLLPPGHLKLELSYGVCRMLQSPESTREGGSQLNVRKLLCNYKLRQQSNYWIPYL